MDANNNDQLESSASAATHQLRLEELPHPLLTEISSYLGGVKMVRHAMNTGSEILLAVALTAPQSSWEKCQCTDDNMQQLLLSPASKAVLSIHSDDWGERFEKFAFAMYHMSAGSKPLSDHDTSNDVDLKAILICIDAKNNTKSLKLTGCPKIVGRGLEPIMGSTVLERIDLCMIASRKIAKSGSKEVGLSEEVVLPILRSLLGAPLQSSLRHVELPLQWREKKSAELTAFMEDYNEFLENIGIICQHKRQGRGSCENEADMGMHMDGERYGIQTATCHDCLKHFCTEADCACGYSFDFCPACQKYYCGGCGHIQECAKCQKSSCMGCFDVHLCTSCFSSFCMGCSVVNYCSKCHKSACMGCEMMSFCLECFKTECNDCSEMMYCSGCYDCFCGDCSAGKVSYCEFSGEILCSKCHRK